MDYHWWLSFHLISLIAWFAGLFYYPRLLAYHSLVEDDISHQRFLVMERRLMRIIMTPAMLLTILFGACLVYHFREQTLWLIPWFQVKIALVCILVFFHHKLMAYGSAFQRGTNQHSNRFFRIINEVPTLLLIAIILLAEFQPHWHW